MSEIEISTAKIRLGDGVTLRLLLCKDARKIDAALAEIECQDLDDEQYLVHTPDLRTGIVPKDASQEKRTGAECRLCRQPVYHWQNDRQQRIHCGCTIWIMPLNVDGAAQTDQQTWMGVVRAARRGITQWLSRS
jgi:hypothetical protein